MRNPLRIFKRHRVTPIVVQDVLPAQVTNPEVTLEHEKLGLKTLLKVHQTATVAAQIRQELANGALLELRGSRR